MKAFLGIGSRLAALGACAALAAGCGGSATGTSTGGLGTLRVALADAPACGFDQVNVTVDRVRVHQSASATENDAGWSEIVLSPARRVDLLSLTNGVMFDLGQTVLASGQYQQVRLVLVPNSGSGTPANSVVPTGGTETELSTPSAIQSGIKLNAQFTVPTGQLVDLVLDFDACKSVVQEGNGRYQLKPVIAVIPLAVSGGIAGTLATTISGTAVTQARVSAQKDGNVLRATVPDSTGRYVLTPVDARLAPYELVVSMPGAATAVVTGVPMTIGGTTNVPPITLAAGSTAGTVSGTVAPAAALPAAVRALQAVASVPAVEVASQNTDGAGMYTLSLPRAAAQLAGYSATTLSFSASATATTAGKYTIEATPATGSAKTAPADITGGNATANFTFP